MTKISNQYSLTNILTADLANSRLGINNVSPAYALDVTGTARVSGVLTTTADAVINTISVGLGGGAVATNTALGYQAANANTTGQQNTAVGYQSLITNTISNANTALGALSLYSNTGQQNTAAGVASLYYNTTGQGNVAFGHLAGMFISGGVTANTITNNSIFIGKDTKPLADNQTNQIVIGYNSTGLGSNTTVLGNSSTVTTAIYGNLLLGTTTAAGYKLDVNGTARVQSFTTINAAPAVNGDAALTVNTNTAASSSNQMYGIRSVVTVSSTNTGNVSGFESTINNPSTATSMSGFNASVNISANTTAVASAFRTGCAVIGTGVVTSFVGFEHNDIFKSGSGAITRQFGIRIANLTAGSSTNVGILLNNAAGTTVTGTWDIYAQSGNTSYLAGNLLLGSTTDAGYKLDVNGTARVSGAATFSSSVTASSSIFSTTAFGGTFKASDGTNIINFGSYYNTIGSGNSYDGVIYTTHASSAFYIMTGGSTTPKFTITSAGNVEIGAYVYARKSTSGVAFTTSNGVNADWEVETTSGGLTYMGTSGNLMAINRNGGSVVIGRTTAGLFNTTGTTLSAGSIQAEGNSYVFYGNRTSSDGLFMGIRRNNVDVGSITVTTSATAFNTSSDYRLKTDFKDYNGLSLINSIKTYDYAWTIDNTRAYGVKAHELQELLPYMVFGEKDATNEDDSIKPQAVDYSKIVPILVKAIQELSTEINLLKQK